MHNRIIVPCNRLYYGSSIFNSGQIAFESGRETCQILACCLQGDTPAADDICYVTLPKVTWSLKSSSHSG